MRAMTSVLPESQRVDLLLAEKADRLSGEDLLRISEVADQAGAAIHISYRSWQILIGVPAMRQQEVLSSLRELGYNSDTVRVKRKYDPGFRLEIGERR
jgi:dissimilatory sulfite reductase (desulfoviridin) alpha/beta subunit